jgi:hypothetical protein
LGSYKILVSCGADLKYPVSRVIRYCPAPAFCSDASRPMPPICLVHMAGMSSSMPATAGLTLAMFLAIRSCRSDQRCPGTSLVATRMLYAAYLSWWPFPVEPMPAIGVWRRYG